MQAADPAAALYLPGVQALHWAPDPVYPALQMHSVWPAVDCAWAGHAGVCVCVCVCVSVRADDPSAHHNLSSPSGYSIKDQQTCAPYLPALLVTICRHRVCQSLMRSTRTFTHSGRCRILIRARSTVHARCRSRSSLVFSCMTCNAGRAMPGESSIAQADGAPVGRLRVGSAVLAVDGGCLVLVGPRGAVDTSSGSRCGLVMALAACRARGSVSCVALCASMREQTYIAVLVLEWSADVVCSLAHARSLARSLARARTHTHTHTHRDTEATGAPFCGGRMCPAVLALHCRDAANKFACWATLTRSSPGQRFVKASLARHTRGACVCVCVCVCVDEYTKVNSRTYNILLRCKRTHLHTLTHAHTHITITC